MLVINIGRICECCGQGSAVVVGCTDGPDGVGAFNDDVAVYLCSVIY
jgi:hypothetical protein